MATETLEAARTGTQLPPRLLFKTDEMREMRKMQAIAKVEREYDEAGQPQLEEDQ